MQTAATALNRFSIIDTDNAEAMRDIMVSRYGAVGFEPTDRSSFQGRSATARLGSASLVMCGYGAPAVALFPEADFVRVQFAFSGTARTTVAGRTMDVSPDQACIVQAERPSRMEFASGFQQILIRLDQRAVERKLTAMLGAPPRRPLEYSPMLGMNQRYLDGMRNLIRFVTCELAASPAETPHFLLEEFEQTLIVAFLKFVPNSFSEMLHRPLMGGALAHVRLVEEYIDAHWSSAISIEQLAKVTGVGTRTIFATFKQHRGYTPHAYLKMVRLKNAHIALLSPTQATSVTSVAFECGFSNLGHFANDYRETFGELPSNTLAHARRAQ